MALLSAACVVLLTQVIEDHTKCVHLQIRSLMKREALIKWHQDSIRIYKKSEETSKRLVMGHERALAELLKEDGDGKDDVLRSGGA